MQKIKKVFKTLSLWVIKPEENPREPFPPAKSLAESKSGALPERRKDLDRLFTDLSRSLRTLSALSKTSSQFLIREKHEELGRLLSELQRRMRMLDEHHRLKYEARAEIVLAHAAKVGITVPPP